MIHNLAEKIKAWQDELFWLFLSVLFVSTCVGGWLLLGRQRMVFVPIIDRNAFVFEQNARLAGGEGEYAASKNGTKYYSPGCAGVQRIKSENRITFYSEADAIAAGYSKSSLCD